MEGRTPTVIYTCLQFVRREAAQESLDAPAPAHARAGPVVRGTHNTVMLSRLIHFTSLHPTLANSQTIFTSLSCNVSLGFSYYYCK